MIIVAITGASGVIYGIRLLEVLKELDIESGLVISDAAKTVIESETEYEVDEIIKIADNYYDFNDMTASKSRPSPGSSKGSSSMYSSQICLVTTFT